MNDIQSLLRNHKKTINKQLSTLITRYKQNFNSIGTTSEQALTRFGTFAHGGKGIRGSLAILSAEMYGYKDDSTLLDIAVCLELLQASLLIHDDIMDNDFTRRGNPSLFAQYTENGESIGASDSLYYGKSMGICIGDIGFFIAMDIAQQSLKNHKNADKLMNLLHNELITVGLAQMDDVTFAASKESPTTEEILRMYLYKTAHYTFSLPLSIGAILADQSEETIKKMEQLGEHLGLLFQLKDDEIGIYSNQKTIGKPIGSDIRENKKTVLRSLLYKKITSEEKYRLERLFQNDQVSDSDIEYYLSLLETYAIKKEIQTIINLHKTQAEKVVSTLSVSEQSRTLLQELITYINNRTS